MNSIVIKIPADAAQKAAKATEVESKYLATYEEVRAQRALVDALPKTKTGKYTKVASDLLKTLADKTQKAREEREGEDAVAWNDTARSIAYDILDKVNSHSKFTPLLEDFGWEDITKTFKPDYNQRREVLAAIPTRKLQLDWAIELTENDKVFYRAGQLYGIYIVVDFNPKYHVPSIKYNGYLTRIGTPRWHGRRNEEHVDDGHDNQHFLLRDGRLVEAQDVLRHGHYNQPGIGSWHASEWLRKNADIVSVLQLLLAWREEVIELETHAGVTAEVIRLAVSEGKDLQVRRVTYKRADHGDADDYHYSPMTDHGTASWHKDVLVLASNNADWGKNVIHVNTLANIRLTSTETK